MIEDEVDTATVEEGLDGSVTFDKTCTPTERTQILNAMAIAQQRLWESPNPLTACMASFITSPDLGEGIENILNRIRVPGPTKMSCTSEGTGFAARTFGGIGENIQWHSAYLAVNPTVESMAGVILHEMAHDYGFDHQGGREYEYSVNARFEDCYEAALAGHVPSVPRRAALPTETELARAGSSGGAPFERMCPGNTWVAGIEIGFGNVLNGVRLRCIDASGVTQGQPTAGNVDGAASRATGLCPTSGGTRSLAVGLSGRAGARIDRLDMSCAFAGSTTDVAVPIGGGPGGTQFGRRCPTGMVLVGVRGRIGAELDALSPVCRLPQIGIPTSTATLAFHGSTTGYEDDRVCSGLAPAVGLYGRSGAVIDRLGAYCEPFVIQSGQAVRNAALGHITPASGGTGGAEFGSANQTGATCPAGQALVGVDFRSGTQIDMVRGVCAPIAAWRGTGPQPSLTVLDNIGGTGGTLSFDTCPRGTFVVGLRTFSTNVINGAQLRCRAL